MIEDLAQELERCQAKEERLKLESEVAMTESGLREKILGAEIVLADLKEQLHAVSKSFEIEMIPLKSRIDVLLEALVTEWAGSDKPATIELPSGILQFKASRRVVIDAHAELLAQIIGKHTPNEVIQYVTLKKLPVRKFLSLFQVDPDVARIETTYTASLKSRLEEAE